MDSISTLLGGHAAPQTIEHEGKTYRCGALTQARKSSVERALVARAKSFCETDAERAAVISKAARGGFSFFGDDAQEYIQTVDGMAVLVGILYDIPLDEAERLLLASPAEVMMTVDLAVLESLPRNRREEVLEARKKAKEAAEKAKIQGASEEAPFAPQASTPAP